MGLPSGWLFHFLCLSIKKTTDGKILFLNTINILLQIIKNNYTHDILFFFNCKAIQRQLEEVAEKQRDVEERGVTIEKTIRGETERGTKPHSHTTITLQRSFRQPETLFIDRPLNITPWINVKSQCSSKKFHFESFFFFFFLGSSYYRQIFRGSALLSSWG